MALSIVGIILIGWTLNSNAQNSRPSPLEEFHISSTPVKLCNSSSIEELIPVG